jgi:hypothetical protein
MHRHGTVALIAGVVGAARTHAVICNTGDLSGCRGDLATPPPGAGAAGVGGAHTTGEPG